ncbi:DUF1513 domain-containing protein [Rhizobium sp. RM]|uniref:DUF1513 domain-containing protein n=1 Tax=Rhizobium sp. RM TaxID=2748079 RepID=UPI00110E808F|nr:DUF1513 domain-containing protein [Rhizobium sp. RM]NWJ24598.1 DUF1513 domain-containing protein [Rhizobium sp. RM]TMV16405.1 DUF1513 domain-containing protein [Rhizobium sp. Td3]
MMPGGVRTLIDRRSFMKAAGLPFLATLAPRSLFALERTDAVFASAFRGADGGYGIATVSEAGQIIDRVTLPARAHGMAVSRVSGTVVAFARRPGTFFMALDPVGGREPTVVHTPENRHFYGHGQFSPDGTILYASENDFDGNRGVIGLYDARDSFRRIGEYDAHGIGTHDMTVSDDGTMIVIANGGIETHPDFGRTKLNVDRMEPSLVLLDAATGHLVQKHTMPQKLQQLSTRHVDLGGDGRIWFACQYEGPRNDLPPLVGYFSKGEDVTFMDLPEETTLRLANYVGAIAVNRKAGIVGLTSPNGNSAVELDAKTGQVISETTVRDAAGVAPSAKSVAVSSYDGLFETTRSNVAWDQHIVRMSR